MTDRELIIKVKTDSDKATKKLGRLTKEVDKLTKNVGKNTKTLSNSKKSFDGVAKSTAIFNNKLVKLAATYLSFEGAKKLITTTAEVESGFIGIAKTTGLTGKEFKKLETALLDMSTSMAGVELRGLQGIAETAGQLGIAGVDNILEFTRVITMMATTTELSAGEAATAMAKLGNVLDVPITDFERLGSVINELSNNTNATAGDIVATGQKVAAMGIEFGLTAGEVLGLSATLTELGIKAERGGTAISKVMLEMIKDTDAFAKASGKSVEEFSALMNDKPIEALQLFISELGKLDKFAKLKVLDDVNLKGSEAIATMLKLSSGTTILTKNLKIQADAWAKNTSLQKEYDTASAGLNAQWDRVTSSLTVLAYKIGKELLPMLKILIDDTVKWIDSLDDNAIANFGKSLGVMVDAFIGLGKILAEINDILMPDFLTSEGAGYIDTVAKGLGEVGRRLSEIKTIADAMNAAEDLVGNTDEIETAIQRFDGLKGTYDKLSTSLQKLLSENLKLQETFRGNGSAEAKAQLQALGDEQDRIMKLSMDLSQQRPLDETANSAKLAEGEVKRVSGVITEHYFGRVVNHQEATRKITQQEQTLTDDIISLQNKLAENLIRIENERFSRNLSLADKIKSIQYGLLTESTAYTTKQLDAEKSYYSAKDALASGDLEKYKLYISQYEKLVTDSAGKEIKTTQGVAKTKEETANLAIAGLKKIQDLENKYASIKEANVKKEQQAVIAAKQKELDAIKKANDEASKATKSTHTVDSNAPQVQKEINKLKVPTSSVHTIRERIIPARANGGPLPRRLATGGPFPQRLATGGRFTGSGGVPGYDPTDGDKVNAKLTGGEFVIKRRSVDKIGLPILNQLNNVVSKAAVRSMRLPKLPGYADGGLVGGASTTASMTPAQTPINLNIGGESFGVMGDREVAAALQRFINSEGGL